MFTAIWLMLAGMAYSLQLSPGSFPPPLTAREERHYLALAAQGDLEARNILIERNLRLVAHIMKKYYAQSGDQEDLISIGTIGLIKGITTFDTTKGARLATYAARCIENATLPPMGLSSAKGHPLAENVTIGAFWTGSRRICISFVKGWMRTCGILLYISIASHWAPPGDHRRGDMRRWRVWRTDCAGSGTAED